MQQIFYLRFTLETDGQERSTRRPRYDGTPQLPGARKTSVNVKEATRQQLRGLTRAARAQIRADDWRVGMLTMQQLLDGIANGQLIRQADLPPRRGRQHARPVEQRRATERRAARRSGRAR